MMRNKNFVALLAVTFLSSFSWRSQHHNNQPEFGGSSSVTLFVGAIRANPNPIIDHDEYGNLLDVPIYIRGDEWLHWYEDGDGYTVIEDEGEEEEEDVIETKTMMRSSSAPSTTENRTKRWYYATIDHHTDNLVSTGIRFGSPSYREKIQHMGLKKHTRPSRSSSAPSNRHNDDVQDQSTGRRIRRRRLQSLSHESASSSLNNLVVLIRFSDHVNRTLPSPSDYNILMNGPGGTGTIAPTGSVQDVYDANSYGTFVLNSTVYPWITLSQTEAYYADGRSGVDSTRLFEGIREALDVIDADFNFDLSQFNVDHANGDIYIDAITIIHSGYGAEVGYSDCYGTVEGNRIWSHKYFLVTGDWTSNDGRVTVQNYNINAGLWGRCGSEIARIGLLAHETAHFLGLPDLYDPYGGEGVGAYCLMGNSWGFDGSQLYPPIMSPWSKIELGWLNPITLTIKGDYPLRRSWQYAEVYRINLGTTPTFEYLLIENRQPGSFDALLPGKGGLAIWHIDESMYWESNTREGFPGQAGWPANGNHYHVALLQSDGRYDLERGINGGDSNDLFRYEAYFGVDHLSPSIKSDPNLGPFPNTDTYRLNNVGRTNHYITGVSGKEDHVHSMQHHHHLFPIRAKVI
jgi:M6 family metalloprotease-like protein